MVLRSNWEKYIKYSIVRALYCFVDIVVIIFSISKSIIPDYFDSLITLFFSSGRSPHPTRQIKPLSFYFHTIYKPSLYLYCYNVGEKWKSTEIKWKSKTTTNTIVCFVVILGSIWPQLGQMSLSFHFQMKNEYIFQQYWKMTWYFLFQYLQKHFPLFMEAFSSHLISKDENQICLPSLIYDHNSIMISYFVIFPHISNTWIWF